MRHTISGILRSTVFFSDFCDNFSGGADLLDSACVFQAISRILDHIGADPAAMPDHTAVTPGVPSRVSYMPVTWLQQQAMHLLRSRYQVSEGDLSAMIDLVLPGDGQPFMGMRPETSTGDDELTM